MVALSAGIIVGESVDEKQILQMLNERDSSVGVQPHLGPATLPDWA
jgi:hypothetical protein